MCMECDWTHLLNAYCACEGTQLPNLHIRHGIQHHPTYINKTIAYGAPNIIKKIYTGQLPATYFNDICYGQQAHPRGEFLYSARMERQHELSEPKHLSREQARHVVRDIQDARFRKARQLEQQSALKKKERTRRAEVARLRVAEGVPRGKLAYLGKLERHKEKLDLKIQATKEARRKTLAFIKPLGIDRNRQE
ncbi:uncharacterized protein LOC127856233 isoform X2 [Dreissena polymorpha]|uniref:Uncharacterized protein n=1 Tax=Dreissena polymorpha TaxID=45954 RepID=A0A9D4CB85_DREPO|nr:uncharacterized protein LOC127856233 isoform X2 [Dreissena polymorpha]KAH3720299.1 hypothetical protein DPMN_063195 [Dreissena polymorpha]